MQFPIVALLFTITSAGVVDFPLVHNLFVKVQSNVKLLTTETERLSPVNNNLAACSRLVASSMSIAGEVLRDSAVLTDTDSTTLLGLWKGIGHELISLSGALRSNKLAIQMAGTCNSLKLSLLEIDDAHDQLANTVITKLPKSFQQAAQEQHDKIAHVLVKCIMQVKRRQCVDGRGSANPARLPNK
ncbi:hypothetical protein DCS_08172 [Drechmeria coniospora]|uniref:Cell wall galactomannoprotein n=1 Tax=Drechmeria coniospora TaxID=98403 RepID=A0A151GGJ2_DRECN|nr:hypothetical protein DCS_08172 [Drechmeria coniospora]KYK56204.1 hypothetical protein DCS_08172 [Drechmeria coniospora]